MSMVLRSGLRDIAKQQTLLKATIDRKLRD